MSQPPVYVNTKELANTRKSLIHRDRTGSSSSYGNGDHDDTLTEQSELEAEADTPTEEEGTPKDTTKQVGVSMTKKLHLLQCLVHMISKLELA